MPLRPLQRAATLALAYGVAALAGGPAPASAQAASPVEATRPARVESLVASRAGRLVDVEKGVVLTDRVVLVRGETSEPDPRDLAPFAMERPILRRADPPRTYTA